MPMGVTDVARETSLSKATVHHLLSTLVKRRFVMREPDSTRYRLGWNLYELGSTLVHSIDISRVARPYLDALASQTKSTTLVAILDEGSVLYLQRGHAPGVVHTVADVGRRSPLHATASGKVLLAFADPLLIARTLRSDLQQFTPRTHADPELLRDELAQVRAQGYAVCWQEREVGLSSVAVPLRDYTGTVVACLTTAANSALLDETSAHDYVALLRRTAVHIEEQLGRASQRELKPAPLSTEPQVSDPLDPSVREPRPAPA